MSTAVLWGCWLCSVKWWPARGITRTKVCWAECTRTFYPISRIYFAQQVEWPSTGAGCYKICAIYVSCFIALCITFRIRKYDIDMEMYTVRKWIDYRQCAIIISQWRYPADNSVLMCHLCVYRCCTMWYYIFIQWEIWRHITNKDNMHNIPFASHPILSHFPLRILCA